MEAPISDDSRLYFLPEHIDPNNELPEDMRPTLARLAENYANGTLDNIAPSAWLASLDAGPAVMLSLDGFEKDGGGDCPVIPMPIAGLADYCADNLRGTDDPDIRAEGAAIADALEAAAAKIRDALS